MGFKESINWCLENLDTCRAAVPKVYREDLYNKTVEGVRDTFSELQARIDQSEKVLIVRDNRIKAMYAGDLSPESRLNGYEVIIEAMKKSREQVIGNLVDDNNKLRAATSESEVRA